MVLIVVLVKVVLISYRWVVYWNFCLRKYGMVHKNFTKSSIINTNLAYTDEYQKLVFPPVKIS